MTPEPSLFRDVKYEKYQSHLASPIQSGVVYTGSMEWMNEDWETLGKVGSPAY